MSQFDDKKRIQDIQGLLRTLILSHLSPGESAVDATAGKGRDTLWLAQIVGAGGKVHAFDIQEEALAETARRLAQVGLTDRVVLYMADHARMTDYIKEKVQLVMFNLGYLPGSDHKITTLPESTVTALGGALSILRPGGILAITVYRGHPGAVTEAQAVEGFLNGLEPKQYSVLQGSYINQRDDIPYWILVQKHWEV